ncbi:MAG TPA: BON domain-containing protein [Pyrinomonadaceae bacterium]|nr:BON domain-containing protein [Pyrinomonadaceae bacterium]
MRIINKLAFVSLSIATLFSLTAKAQDVESLKSIQSLERTVFKRINNLPYYGVFDQIGFRVEGSTVVLTGKVAQPRNRKDAEIAIRDVPGIKAVVNNIEILPLSPYDDAIRRKTLRTFYRDGSSLSRYVQEPRPSIRIIVENGNITLEGNVTYKSDSDFAYMLARTVTGVFNVTNNLTVGTEMYR